MFVTKKALQKLAVCSSRSWNQNLRPMMIIQSAGKSTVATFEDKSEQDELVGDRKFATQLEQDARLFFLREQEGNLWPYLYGAPEHKKDKVDGGRLYLEALRNVSEYYLYDSEGELFQSQARKIAEVIGPNATVIELGPGSTESVSRKTIPLLKALPELNGYMGIDISLEFLEKTLETIQSAIPDDIVVEGHQKDFFQLSALQTDNPIENPVILFKGSTIGNLPQDRLPDFLSQVPRLVGGRKHFFLVAHDCNQDVDSLMRAYTSPESCKMITNVMYRLERDVPSIRFDPSLFRYTPQYDPNTYDFGHFLSATSDQTVDLSHGSTVSIKSGDRFKTCSSFKYPVDVFQDMVAKTGAYDPVDVCTDNSGRMVCHILESK